MTTITVRIEGEVETGSAMAKVNLDSDLTQVASFWEAGVNALRGAMIASGFHHSIVVEAEAQYTLEQEEKHD